MKQQWQRLAARVDALTLRERIVIFGMLVLLLAMMFNILFLDPQYSKQKQLADHIGQEQEQIATMRTEIQQKTIALQTDPDSGNRAKLKQLRARTLQLKTDLINTQKSLVAPEKMADVLEDILKRNRNLTLVSLRNLPVVSLGEMSLDGQVVENMAGQGGKGKGDVAAPESQVLAGPVFSHRVEISVRGNYPDLLDYLEQLESMSWKLNWSTAKLQVDDLGISTLTLTLFTLSLDRKWLNL